MSDMQIKEALNALEDGHTIWKVAYAKRVCKALGIPFNDELIETYYSGNGLYINPESKGTRGVDGLALSQYAAEHFHLDTKVRQFIGQGSQAREYARLVREALEF